MGRKATPGLYKRGNTWHIDKHLGGHRVRKSTGANQLEEAERFLARLSEEIRQAQVYGVRPQRTFEEAAVKYVLEHQHKRSIHSDIGRLKLLLPWIGQVPLDRIHRGTMEPWVENRRQEGAANATINQGLKIVRRILNLAASEWVDEHGLTWLLGARKIRLLPNIPKRKPYPLNWEEQDRLFQELPTHLAEMALFAVNTGCRDGEICGLRWDWEVKVPELDTIVFIVPGDFVKNGDERLIVLNRITMAVIDGRRGRHPTHVFSFRGRPVQHMLNTGWQKARVAVGLRQVRVHDLKHTFGRRLRAAGVSFEDRQDLLGHRSSRITTHYSAAELERLIQAASTVCDRGNQRPQLVVMRRMSVG